MKGSLGIALALALAAAAARGDPIQSEIAITVPERTTTVRAFVRSTDFSGAGVDTWELQSEVAYGLTARTNLLLFVPVMEKSARVGGVTRRARGLGDVALLVKQRVWKRNRLQTQDRVSLIGGVKLPTGENGESDRLGRLPHALQPGTGSFDFPVGILYAHDAPRGFFADLLYTVRTRDSGYRFGNTLRYDLAYTHAVTGGRPRQHFVWAVLELNGLRGARDRRRGEGLADTGGHVLFLSPGLRLVHWSGRWVVDLSYQIPVMTDYPAGRGDPRRSWLAGLRANF